MSLSSVCVVSNALRLRGWKPNLPKVPTGAPASSPVEGGDPGEAADPKETPDENHNEKEIAMEKTLHVEGMMCQHCVAHVKKALEGVEGVKEAVVDLGAKTAVAKLARDVDAEALTRAVVEAGYEVTSVE